MRADLPSRGIGGRSSDAPVSVESRRAVCTLANAIQPIIDVANTITMAAICQSKLSPLDDYFLETGADRTPGSAPLPGAGQGVSPSRTFSRFLFFSYPTLEGKFVAAECRNQHL